MRFRTLALTTGALAIALVLAGCAPTGSSMPGMDHGPGGMTSTTPDTTEEASFNSADEMFVTMMIPHHEQAIQMADQILAKDGIDERVVALAHDLHGVVDRGQPARRELDVEDRSGDLDHASGRKCGGRHVRRHASIRRLSARSRRTRSPSSRE